MAAIVLVLALTPLGRGALKLWLLLSLVLVWLLDAATGSVLGD